MSPSRTLPSRIGPFHVIQELGRGSNGAVYLARRDGVGDPCALKLLLHADSEGQARFDLEAAICGRLVHPLIVGAFESGTHERYKWIAMDYVEGENLQQRLVRGPLEPGKARRLFGDMAEALEFAHQRGVIHRDLKPANILIDGEGRARLTDFGLARTLSSNLTRAGDMIGTPYYMAPEQLEDPTGVDAKADIYALGVMLYEALSGMRPFEGKTIPVVTRAKRRGLYEPLAKAAPQVPPELAGLCERAMAHAPKDRFASARELCAALRGEVRAPRGEGETPRSERTAPAGGPALATLLVGAALAVALLVLTLAFARWRGLAREESAKQALEEGRAALASGDLAAARQALDQVEAAGFETIQASAADELSLLVASERLSADDLGPAQELLTSAPPAGLEDAYRRLARALTIQEASSLTEQVDVEPAWLLDLGDRLLGLSDQPGLPAARETLAMRALALARRLSEQREPYQLPLGLLQLAERAAEANLSDEARLERASYLFRRGRFQEASEVAGSLARRPGRLGYQARYVAAFGQLWQGRYEAGLTAMRALYQDDPQGAVGLNAGAVYSVFSGEDEVGEGLVERSLEIDPAYVDAWITLTFCRNDMYSALGAQDRPEEARRKLEQALEANSQALRLQRDDPRAWMSRAFVVGNMGREEEAMEAYSTTIELTEPRPFARALLFRAKHLVQRQDARGALVDLNRALERDPNDIEALTWRGLVHDQLGDPRAAELDWSSAARKNQRAFNQHLGSLSPQVVERVRELFSRRR